MSGISDIEAGDEFENYLGRLSHFKGKAFYPKDIDKRAGIMLENEHDIKMFEGQLKDMSDQELATLMNADVEDLRIFI